ncbi:MAG: hypothetical protein S4CHLAM45_15010 [Chlamydiales bacterium]|nr:hypothetical protein [Chlamydiales bacterium]MCH9620118.1 hypothetical protein [Chlamydiales bacterium]MCH9623588.1 hypothetical protein [Chlamydiales bacterium]
MVMIRDAAEVFFNTQSRAPRCFFQLVGEFALTPVRFFFGGRTVKIVHNTAELQNGGKLNYNTLDTTTTLSQFEWAIKTMPKVTKLVMGILFLPGLIVGTICKIVAYCNFVFPELKPVIKQQRDYYMFRQTFKEINEGKGFCINSKNPFFNFKGQTVQFYSITYPVASNEQVAA